MGFFDRFSGKKPAAPLSSVPAQAASAASTPAAASLSAPVSQPTPPRLAAAREKLDLKDLAGAMAIYEELLTGGAGDRADVLVAISGDLGSRGHVAEIVELIAPRYDADRHGPATGLNLLQAYLAMRNPDAAQHVLDILFELKRPELEDRLHGFSNAIAELIAAPEAVASAAAPEGAQAAKVELVTISKPIWFYGLEPLAERILPPKEGRLRRIAFAQLALPGYLASEKETRPPDDELARLARAIPLWFTETFYFSPRYAPVTVVGLRVPPESKADSRHFVFGAEWATEHLRQLVESSSEGVDYIVTGALRANAGDYEIVLRIWEVKTFRERKTFNVRWTPATADAALAQLHAQVRAFMEWLPASAAFAYAVTVAPRAWLDTLGASVGLFLADKGILARGQLAPVEADLAAAAQRAAAGEGPSLAFLTLQDRATRLGAPAPAGVTLARSPLVLEAQKLFAR